MSNELITKDEIKQLKTKPRHLSWKDVVPRKGLKVPIDFIELDSGYVVSYTIDDIFIGEPKVRLGHVIVTAIGFEPDPADMDHIAIKILGDCYRPPAQWYVIAGDKKVKAHYIKLMGVNKNDLKRFTEEGIERGVEVVEVRK